MMKYADLHTHTNFSDGTFTPGHLVRQALKEGLSCIAVTDHDAVLAIEPAMQEAEKSGLEIIAGIELSAESNGSEIHILGYCIDWQEPWFQRKLAQICQARKERLLAILEKLRGLGINLDSEPYLQQNAVGSLGRPHIARLLKKQGFVHSIQEAFNRYLGNGQPCYVKKFKLTSREAIEMISRLGGIAVLAHPHNIAKEEIIPELVQSGLKGLEVYYPEYDQATTEHYQNLARQYGLLITGGSDCHGEAKDKLRLGAIKIPYSLVEKLKQQAQYLRDGRKK